MGNKYSIPYVAFRIVYFGITGVDLSCPTIYKVSPSTAKPFHVPRSHIIFQAVTRICKSVCVGFEQFIREYSPYIITENI